eukprot:GHUV01056477.1.p1 GENE.GHUV01056477.1~~GHUV01056477.1.p1  ORF type:complete len:100 (-),score=20.78 GHUV01056477.1:65-364(-)
MLIGAPTSWLQAKPEKKVPSLDELLDSRDYVGAITLLKFKLQGSRSDVRLTEWLAYAHYHHGEHDKVSTAPALNDFWTTSSHKQYKRVSTARLLRGSAH